PLLVVQPRRDCNVDQQPKVAVAPALEHRHPAPTQNPHVPRLRSRVEVELELAVQRRDGDLAAQRCLGHRQVDRREQVVALADEARVRLDVDEHVQVAGLGAELTNMSLAADPDPLAVVDAGRHRDSERALLDYAAGAVARSTAIWNCTSRSIPRAASTSSISISAATSAPRAARPRRPPRPKRSSPKNAEKRSPSVP